MQGRTNVKKYIRTTVVTLSTYWETKTGGYQQAVLIPYMRPDTVLLADFAGDSKAERAAISHITKITAGVGTIVVCADEQLSVPIKIVLREMV